MGLLDKITDVVTSPLGALGIDVGGTLYGNYASAKAATKAFDREKWLMSNKYQMQVADLKAAGLNPALAYGAPAPIPGVPQATQRGVERASSSALNARLMQAQAADLEASAALKGAQAITEAERPGLVESERELNIANRALSAMNYNAVLKSIDKMSAEVTNLYASAAAHNAAARLADATIPKLFAEIKELGTRSSVQKMDAILKDLSVSQQQQLLPYLVQMGVADSYLRQLMLPEAEALAAKWRSQFGQSALPWVHEAQKMIPGFGVILGGKK